ncbi:hypothetical protein [Brevibacillus sp. SIMBA_040]|uniref:hypothetical protein n=1 Tax=unclassified Brevibacillus TaxID=2684853 RepID=UPI00397A6639
MYTWNKSWCNFYDSPWSTLEKFKFANILRSNDVLKLFSINNFKSINEENWCISDRDLLFLANIDEVKSRSILGFSIHDQNNHLIHNLLKPYFNVHTDKRLYFQKNLIFCVECMAIGFHSVFHQFNMVNKCPFHLIQLHQACPQCNRKFRYSVTDSNWSHAFCCKCGMKFLNFEKGYVQNLWKQNNLKIIDKDLIHWINYPDRSEYIVDLRWIFRDKSVKQNLVDQTYKVTNKYVVYRSKFLKDYRKIDGSIVEQELVKSMRSVKKAISRHIRRHVIRKHRKCVAKFVRGYPDNAVCPVAYAYVLWRQKIDNFKQYWQVDNSNLYNYDLESFSIENCFLSRRLDSLQSNLGFSFDSFTTEFKFWIINWYYGENLLQNFIYQLLKVKTSTNVYSHTSCHTDFIGVLPTITIKVLNENPHAKKFEIRKWANNESRNLKLGNQLKCPHNEVF